MQKTVATVARRWLVHGRVQGVGYRWFVLRQARELGITGWVRNEADGGVQAYGVGTVSQLDRLAGYLHQGPMLSEVRTVHQSEAAVEKHSSFEIR